MSGLNGEDRSQELNDDESEIDEDDLRTLVDEEGNELVCVLLAVLGYEDKDYALLATLDSLESDEEALDVFVLEYEVDEEGVESFFEVQDETTYEAVVAYAETLLPGGSEEARD